MMKFSHIFIILLLCGLAQDKLLAEDFNADDAQPAKTTSQNDIKIYIDKLKNSEFASFKGTAIFNTTMDTLLAIFLDSASYVDWVYECKESFLLAEKSFNERYHYQVINLPFPFNDRDMIIYTKLHQEPETGDFFISLFADADFCNNNNIASCKKIKPSGYVRIKDIVGSYRFQKTQKGIKVTWIQHTEPGGKLPGWLVNHYVVDTPYKTLLNVAKKLEEEKYKQAKLVYNEEGKIVSLEMPEIKPGKTSRDFIPFPTF